MVATPGLAEVDRGTLDGDETTAGGVAEVVGGSTKDEDEVDLIIEEDEELVLELELELPKAVSTCTELRKFQHTHDTVDVDDEDETVLELELELEGDVRDTDGVEVGEESDGVGRSALVKPPMMEPKRSVLDEDAVDEESPPPLQRP